MQTANIPRQITIAIMLACASLARSSDGPYTIRSTYATTDTCAYKTKGIYIVWWDKKFDYAQQAAELLESLMDVRNDCLNKYGMSDPPNPLAGYYYNVYVHNGSDVFKSHHWAMGQGTDENKMPFLTIPIGYAKRDSSGPRHEGFHIFQYRANSPGFTYSGDSQWFIEATANWYAALKKPDSVDEFVTASAVTAVPHVPLWYSFANKEKDDQDNWQRGCHQYGMNILLNYLTITRKISPKALANSFYQNRAELPQEFLYNHLGKAKFCDTFADFAAHNVSGYPLFPAGVEERAARELKTYGAAADLHPFVRTFSNNGTGGAWLRPDVAVVTRGWGYNVFRIDNSMEATYTFALKGDEKGSEGATSAFRARLVVRTGNGAKVHRVMMSGPREGQAKLRVAASDAEIYLVVAATPSHFRGNQTFSYQVKIDRAF